MRIQFTDGPRKGETVEVDKDKVVIGRDPSADIVLDDDEVSRKHAQITVDGDEVEVRDLGSQNGTKVGRSRVRDAQNISSSDKVRVGGSAFTVDAGTVGATRLAGGTRGGTRGAGAGGTRLSRGAPAMLEVITGPDKGKSIEVTSSGVTIGREDSADVKLDDEEISSEHVELKTRDDGSVEVTDLDSRNGTSVDGRQISRPVAVGDGSEITIGRSKLKVSTTARGGGRAAKTGGGGGPDTRVIAAVVGGIVVVVGVLLIAGVFGGGDDESDEPLATPEIAEAAEPSTVQVLARLGGRTQPLGTGWVLDNEEGLIATNAHVVEGAPDGSRYAVAVDDFPRRAEVWAVAPCEDLAILRTAGLELPNMPLGDQSEVEAGDTAVAVGYPGNLTLADELTINEGTVSVAQTRAEADSLQPDFPLYENVIQMDTPINGGNSGGPLMNDQGELIGVNTFGTTGLQNVNYAIGVDRVKEITDQMRGGDSLGFAGFGFEGGVVIGPFAGLQVKNVIPDSGADRLGIPAGELIAELNGRPVETRSDYCNAVENLTTGDEATVTGVIGGGRVTFD